MRLLCLSLVLALPAATAAADPVDYKKEIRPVLQERCYACHGALAQKSKLRVDSGANMLKRGVIVPGKPAESELIARVSSEDEETRMPPEGHALKPEQIAKIKAWIEQGATVPADDAQESDPRDHWSFRTPVRSPIPETPNPIDHFIAAKWAEKGLTPVHPADKRVLLRRATLDLTGLPPTAAEYDAFLKDESPDAYEKGLTPVQRADKRILLRRVTLDLTGLPPTAAEYDAFLKDESPDAYEKVVNRLLASPQYGERWGRHFLDIWRYSDWWGLGAELRNSQRHIWHWRDWAVESFNADLGYDEMVRQMLAADELYPTDPAKLRATGYLARPYFLFNRTTWLDEVVEHTGKGFLGLTFNCAKCHDHKYDPIKQADYYSYRALFEPYQVRTDVVPGEADATKNGIPRVFDCNLDAKTPFHIRGDERNPDKERVVHAGLPQFLSTDGLKISAVKVPPEAYQPLRRAEIARTLLRAAELKWARAMIAAAEREERSIGKSLFARLVLRGPAEQALAAAKAELQAIEAAIKDPAKAPPAHRGSLKSAESNIETAESKARPFPDTSTGRRTALAKWIADAKNPLTARVAVNHVWLRHFGQPLVPTVFEFGRRGTPPTHLELLDWLAVEFADKKWSFKHLHRLIVTSRAYRLSSSSLSAEANARIDGENHFLWRMNSTRMDANTIRDSLLHLAGALDFTPGGPPIPTGHQDASRRRSMYFFHSHNDHNKLLDTFDNANVLECYRRTESIVPQQALALWNSSLAQTMGGKINDALHSRLKDAGDADFIAAAFETVLGTPPNHGELVACLDSLVALRAALSDLKEPDRTKRARLQLVQALLNHNDFVTVR